MSGRRFLLVLFLLAGSCFAVLVERALAEDAPAATGAAHDHWAYRPLKDIDPPTPRDGAWAHNPIDRFILHDLEVHGVRPAPPADRRTLLRRVYLDLIGIPPTPAEQQAFLADKSADAFARVVDDLLARPQYGERWGRHWLDVVRYAETQGYERDEPKPYAWRYRDYVIDAFNSDKPYDRFLTEQLAGDELDGADSETRTATSFLRIGPFDTIAADRKLARYDQLDDVVGTTASAFLGMSIRCARCHDHKFEPIPQADYYRMLSIFEPLKGDGKATLVGSAEQIARNDEAVAKVDAEVEPLEARLDVLRLQILDRASAPDAGAQKKQKIDRGAAKKLSGELTAALRPQPAKRSKQEKEQLAKVRLKVDAAARRGATDDEAREYEQLQTTIAAANAKRPAGMFAYVFTEDSQHPGATHIFLRGDVNQPGPEVQPRVPSVLQSPPPQPPEPTAHTSGRRLWLAHWMTGPASPLVARVMANRVWQYHFGRGIVGTPNDLGTHGDPPTHPELLDYLAQQLVANGWHLKSLHRAICLSNTYQMSAGYDAGNPGAESDPQDKLLWHFPSHRLESEAMRDQILAVSGALNLERGGPSVYPPLAQKVVGDSAQLGWGTSDEREASRRTVYVYVKRATSVPELEVLGLPDTSSSCDVRSAAITPLQPLMLLNSKFITEQAVKFAERVKRDAGDDPAAQVRRAFELALCRGPRADELEAALAFLKSQPAPSAPQKPANDQQEVLSPLGSFCLVLLNTSEFAYAN